MTILRILFVGMMAFAPDDPSQVGRVTVLLRDARTATDLGEECIQPHLPLLHWDATCSGDCTASHPQTFWTCDQLPVTIEEYDSLWVLAEEELKITFSGAEIDRHWKADQIGTMSEIHKNQWGHGPAKTLHSNWTGPKVKPRQGLVARIQLDNGVFEDCHLVDWEGQTANLWYTRLQNLKSQGKDSQHSGAATDVVLATMTAPEKGQTVKVAGNTFNGKHVREITLEPISCGDGTDNDCITLIVENQSTLVADRSRFGRHFERLYRFSQKAKAKNRWVPFVPAKEPQAPMGTAAPSCAAARGRFHQVLGLLLSGTKPARDELALSDHAFELWNLGNRPICPQTQY